MLEEPIIAINFKTYHFLLKASPFTTGRRSEHHRSWVGELWKRRLFFKSSIKKLLIEFSPRIIRFYNYISGFLDSLRRYIKSIFNLPVKFLVQNIFQVFCSYIINKFFMEFILQNIRSINSCYGLVSVNKITNSKKLTHINLLGYLEGKALCNLHINKNAKIVYKVSAIPPRPNGRGLLAEVV